MFCRICSRWLARLLYCLCMALGHPKGRRLFLSQNCQAVSLIGNQGRRDSGVCTHCSGGRAFPLERSEISDFVVLCLHNDSWACIDISIVFLLAGRIYNLETKLCSGLKLTHTNVLIWDLYQFILVLNRICKVQHLNGHWLFIRRLSSLRYKNLLWWRRFWLRVKINNLYCAGLGSLLTVYEDTLLYLQPSLGFM